MTKITLDFTEITAKDLPIVGGKGANLGELTKLVKSTGFISENKNIPDTAQTEKAGLAPTVPPGFCVTVEGFSQFMTDADEAGGYYAQLAQLAADDLAGARKIGGAFRAYLKTIAMPNNVRDAVVSAWQQHGETHFYAVRSSATAEDLPTASFAGQQDTYLNIRGEAALLESVRDCWISLFTDRAILYRAQNGFDHKDVLLSVVVQRMVLPETSGILFTADPVNGHRQIISIDASFGLGEALVAGMVTPDLYKVDKRDGAILDITVSDKQVAIWPKPEGGTVTEDLSEEQRHARVLSDAQIVALANASTAIETHYGLPQDIEWAIENDEIYILQARPITSLFPVPHAFISSESERVYISLSHAQVMTEPLSPMGISVWRALLPFGKEDHYTGENPYITFAGGRFYADLTALLYTRIGKQAAPRGLVVADELIGLALGKLVARDTYEENKKKALDKATLKDALHWIGPLVRNGMKRLWFSPPEQTKSNLNTHVQEAIERAQATQKGSDLLVRVQNINAYLQSSFTIEATPIMPVVMVIMMSQTLLKRLLGKHADQQDMAAIQSGLVGNVTTEMDLLVGDLADIARKNTAIANAFENEAPETLIEHIKHIDDSDEFLNALDDFMKIYGLRGPGEIDIARSRWLDDPASLLQVMRGSLRNPLAGEHRKHYQGLIQKAAEAEARLIEVARSLPLGWLKAKLARRLLKVFRAHMPMREHPKFMLVHFFQITRELMQETAQVFKTQGRMDNVEDIWYLVLPEAIEALEKPELDIRERITQRKQDYEHYARLTPPRVITSHGEIITASRSIENLPEGAIVGSPVSAGVVEGIARIIMDPAKETLNPGEILVAPSTDPAWTPLFINAAGVVLEVGGLMTHGSVVAREYGIPAVVSVPDATTLIKTGQRLRVNGELGFVEIID